MSGHWSVDGESAETVEPAEPGSPNDSPPPPRMPAVQRSAELWEALFVLEPAMVSELLDELARCSVADLVKMFGSSASIPAGVVSEPQPTPVGALYCDGATGEPAAVEPPAEPSVSQPDTDKLTTAEQLLANLNASRWDENGRRIGKGISAFEWTRTDRPPPKGSHWSR
jgi:hypothetical protein